MKSFLLVMIAPALLAADIGVLRLENSPFAKLHNVPVSAVKIQDGFWSPRRKTNVEKSIPTMLTLLEEHGVSTSSAA